MSISQTISLLEFCLTHTYFLFQGKYYEQVQGAAMGSPISPIIANIFMEEFEVKALQSFSHPLPYGSGLWMTLLSSIRQNTAKTYSSTSTARTHTSNSQWSPPNMDHYPPGHPSHHTTRQHIQHHSLQEAYTHRPIPPLGQQPPHHCQTKCLQYLSPQSQNSFFNTGQSPKGTLTHQNSPPPLPVPLLGPQPMGAQVQPHTTSHSPRQQQQQQQQLIQQQQIQSNHSGSLHQQNI